nr:probable WRKY transcription factor 51 isoform X1 [Ipomoea batatas]GME15381.1 probable WRKY transcription factor 51 isoform X1 [Ipomoea batatas]
MYDVPDIRIGGVDKIGALPVCLVEPRLTAFNLNSAATYTRGLNQEDEKRPPSLNGWFKVASSLAKSECLKHLEKSMRQMVVNKTKTKERHSIAFRTKTELEMLDDGYKWRKYGKKKVKSNSNPRNYYKCSHEGCIVKKRVERDGEDSKFLITEYEGIHNHESPYVIYYY